MEYLVGQLASYTEVAAIERIEHALIRRFWNVYETVTLMSKFATFLVNEVTYFRFLTSSPGTRDMTLQRTSTFFSALFIIAAFLLAPSPAKAQLGVNAGLNFSSVDDIDATDRSATLENSTGYHLGVVYNLGVGPVALRPAVVYRQIGDYQFALPGDQEPSYAVSAWEVPVDVKLSFSLPLISPYVLVGPMATFPRGDGELDDAMEDISYTLNAGVGGSLSLGSVTFEPELRYEFGATEYFQDDFEIAGTEFTPEDSPSFSAFSLRLNILF